MVKTKLQEVRIKRGLSQDEVADLLGMTQPNYSRKENGITKISQKEWEFIARKLDVTTEEIFEADETTVIYKSNKGNSFNSGTIHINIPEFILEHLELLKQQNELLKEEIQALKTEKIKNA